MLGCFQKLVYNLCVHAVFVCSSENLWVYFNSKPTAKFLTVNVVWKKPMRC